MWIGSNQVVSEVAIPKPNLVFKLSPIYDPDPPHRSSKMDWVGTRLVHGSIQSFCSPSYKQHNKVEYLLFGFYLFILGECSRLTESHAYHRHPSHPQPLFRFHFFRIPFDLAWFVTEQYWMSWILSWKQAAHEQLGALPVCNLSYTGRVSPRDPSGFLVQGIQRKEFASPESGKCLWKQGNNLHYAHQDLRKD